MMKVGIQSQTEAFNLGFQELIPQNLIKFFNYQEFELMLTGLSYIDIEDLQKNTEFQDYSPNSQLIKWFWELLESFSQTELTIFLQFVTGDKLLMKIFYYYEFYINFVKIFIKQII